MSKILIVEDEVKIARFVTLELQHEGYEEEAIRVIRAAMEAQPFAEFDIPIVAEGEHGYCFGKLEGLEVE